jgi:hypothetical protein
MTTLILHIGSNKTGTTSIQKVLMDNYQSLLEEGVLYPRLGTTKLGAHHFLARSLLKQKEKLSHYSSEMEFKDYLKGIKEEISNKNIHTVLISSEALFWAKSVDFAKIKELFDIFKDVRIVSYIRRQDQYIESFYNSRIRVGAIGLGSLEKFAYRIDVDYFENFEVWSSLVEQEKISVCMFEKNRFKDGDLIMDFLDKLSINSSALKIRKTNLNQSANMYAVKVLRILNIFPFINQKTRNNICKFFEKTFPDVSTDKLKKSTRRSLLDKYSESNRKLAEKYCSQSRLFSMVDP